MSHRFLLIKSRGRRYEVKKRNYLQIVMAPSFSMTFGTLNKFQKEFFDFMVIL